MSNGAVLWRGPSALDGEPIVLVATGLTVGSQNQKTGNMLQTWILRADQSPLEAVRTGADASICGDCPHRGDRSLGRGRSCYVILMQAPTAVYRTFAGGHYPEVQGVKALQEIGRGRHVRLGSYGDPAAVPWQVWGSLMAYASGGTGYTHQWRDCDPLLRLWCMASCDTEWERQQALSLGWRTFRVLGNEEALVQGEFLCPASAEAGRKLTCTECRACSGTLSGRRGTVGIYAHGPAGVEGKFEALQQALESQK